MMDKVLARKVLKILNNKELHDILVEYANYRIDLLKDRLVQAKIEDVPGLQISIKELRRFDGLRDEAQESIKSGDTNG